MYAGLVGVRSGDMLPASATDPLAPTIGERLGANRGVGGRGTGDFIPRTEAATMDRAQKAAQK